MSDATVEFSGLCAMFEAVAKTKKGPLKRKHVRTFLDRVYTEHEYFSALRLMLPTLDRVRSIYGLKEAVLGTFLAEALGLAKDSADAQKLLNWRRGGTRAGSNAGNFAIIAYEILYRRQQVTSKALKIKDVNDILDRLAAAKKREGKVAVLAEAIRKTDSQQMRWIMMIILKDLKLGIGEKAIFSEFHPDAKGRFDVCCDLKLVCDQLRNRNERYSRQGIEVGKSVRPQLLDRVDSLDDAWQKLKGKEVTVECKLDGERIQIQKDGTKLNFFSRRFIDHQQYHAAMADVLIQNVLPEKCILDGEMLVWDRANNSFADFGTNRAVAKAVREGLETNEQLCYVAFDLLFSGTSSVIHRPLRQRQELLREAIRPVKGRLELLNPQQGIGQQKWACTAKSVEEVKHFFKRCMENREEGVVLKDLDSKWEPANRDGRWLKFKPDYVDAASDHDLLIIGGYYGSGRNGGQVAQFLLGIAEKPKADEYPTKFHSICRVGSGLSDHQSEGLLQKLNPYILRNEKNSRPPSCYNVTNHSRERPDVWFVPPDKSVILQVTSDVRTVATEAFAAPCGLRFAHVKDVRNDKPWYDCLDVQTLLDRVKDQRGGKAGLNEQEKMEGKTKSTKTRVKKRARTNLLPLVPSHMWNTDVSQVTPSTRMFAGLDFYVINNNPVEHSKDSLHKLVAEHGGTFSMNLTNTVTHAIASERKGIKFQASKAHGDVIHYSWIVDCCTAKTLLPVRPKHFLHLSSQTKEKRKHEIDDFGDHYLENIDPVDLSQIFQNVGMMAAVATDHDELGHVKKNYCSSLTVCQFSDCNFYFHKPIHSTNPDSQMVAEIALKRQELEVSMRAGAVSETLDKNVTHMFTHPHPHPQKRLCLSGL